MEKFIQVVVDHDKKQFHVESEATEETNYDARVEEAKKQGRDVGSFRSRLDTVEKTIDAAQHEYKGYRHLEESPV
ncbi:MULTISPECIES: hypothetical protein [Bacillaceae]|uniref:hypothetical protein n=1 Tax=Bacillales TaxID=1385 RepID=UPI001883E05A|nr:MULTISPECIES: hypothetical protein [Bacillaceae]MBF0706147.1 hypothetical protein [Pseudalkalibacillus hwajinpoensis]MDO6658024.1 hypothetical protein [Anaerobacillus sp. 1_MG-2023]WLR60918.1 hypothetical protein LC071_06195 [Pseudalkalibacillus hwajinpoensis]